jgi:hypothetical protein
MKDQVTAEEIMDIVDGVLIEMYNSEYDLIKARVQALLDSKKVVPTIEDYIGKEFICEGFPELVYTVHSCVEGRVRIEWEGIPTNRVIYEQVDVIKYMLDGTWVLVEKDN